MKRISVIGLTVLCALALTAVIAAAGASAAETTAFTCVSGGSGGAGTKFSDADCTESSPSGGFGHTAIANGTVTDLKIKKLTNPVLKTVIAGAAVTLEATGVECDPAPEAGTCALENKGTAGAMEAFGSGGRLLFTGVTVASSPSKCQITPSGQITTNPLKVQTIGTNEVLLSPVTGTALASFMISSIAPEICPVAGTYTINGDVNGTTNGAILTINVPTTSKTITIGVNGASLVGKATIEAGSGATFHPVALT